MKIGSAPALQLVVNKVQLLIESSLTDILPLVPSESGLPVLMPLRDSVLLLPPPPCP